MLVDDVLLAYLEGVEIRTDEQRMQETQGKENRVSCYIGNILRCINRTLNDSWNL